MTVPVTIIFTALVTITFNEIVTVTVTFIPTAHDTIPGTTTRNKKKPEKLAALLNVAHCRLRRL